MGKQEKDNMQHLEGVNENIYKTNLGKIISMGAQSLLIFFVLCWGSLFYLTVPERLTDTSLVTEKGSPMWQL